MSDHVWDEFSRTLRTSAPYQRLASERGDVVRLPVPASAWVGELLAEDLGRPLIVVVPREADAMAWVEALELFAPNRSTIVYPGSPMTPYQEAAASLGLRARKAVALDRLLSAPGSTIVTTPRALFDRLPRPETFERAVVEIRAEVERPPESLARHFLHFGYQRSDLVSEVGQFAVRGGVFDLYPPGLSAPCRLDFFGDTIDSIRTFDPLTQRSEERLDVVRVRPVGLFPSGPDEAIRLASDLAQFVPEAADPEVARRLDELAEQGETPGWCNYLPLLDEDTVDLITFCALLAEVSEDSKGESRLIWAVDPDALETEAQHHDDRMIEDFKGRRTTGLLAVPPDHLEQPLETVLTHLDSAEVRLRDLLMTIPDAIDFAGSATDLFHGQLPRFPQEVATCQARGERCVLVVGGDHLERMRELLEGRSIEVGSAGVELFGGDLVRGFRLPAAGLAIYGESQILPRAEPQRKRVKGPRYGPFVSGLRDLKVGDFIVHTDHGVGQFVGLKKIGAEPSVRHDLPPTLAAAAPATGDAAEVMEIVYASGRSLLLPLSRLDQIQKFSGIEGVSPRLDKLGGTSWNKTKSRVKRSLRDMAGELLKLYAEREVAQAPAMDSETDAVRQFGAGFPYDETPDQLEAIREISEDLQKTRPMDRLLCGDVGYGKTEVAMRMAFKVVDSGFQVAVLAPTTILADQHLETFRRRFEGLPVAIDMISRFRTPQAVRDVKTRLAEGKIDILIGTHRLLSADIEFPRLGLLIVDEEQRFGVAQKERLKQLKKDVHVLAMSATPVPRTLQLSLAGVREMSVIETPPKDRMAIETAIVPYQGELVREAIDFEIERGGQIYYVYNRVESIESMQTFLKELVPGLRVTVGHGQLEEKELARRMHAFTAREYDVLLATTIIENGIDIPNCNTIIVHRADRFGLAQLYQLRGRVGRSNQLAFCYLLVPEDRVLSEVARKRLAALREFTDLGAGFRIAARDLEIRGAGNLLGAEQSGHIAAVGIETYLKMLEETIRELRGEEVEDAPAAAIDLPVPMAVPHDYVEDANLRMEIYRKIATGEQEDREILAELADRFGQPPPAVHSLLKVASLKRRAEGLRIQSISARGTQLTFRLRQDTRLDFDLLIEMVSNHPGAAFSPTGVLTLPIPVGGNALDVARGALDALAPMPLSEAQAVVN